MEYRAIRLRSWQAWNIEHRTPAVLAVCAIVIAFFLVGMSSKKATIPHVTIGSTVLYYEEAKTPTEQEKGLGNRASLPEDQAMLFRFAVGTKPIFWMKGMQFPLDFIWIYQNKVSQVLEHIAAPLPTLTDDQLPKIVPNYPVDALFEVNAGFVEQYRIRLGDNVTGMVR